MHCLSVAILRHLRRFHPTAVGTNWPILCLRSVKHQTNKPHAAIIPIYQNASSDSLYSNYWEYCTSYDRLSNQIPSGTTHYQSMFLRRTQIVFIPSTRIIQIMLNSIRHIILYLLLLKRFRDRIRSKRTLHKSFLHFITLHYICDCLPNFVSYTSWFLHCFCPRFQFGKSEMMLLKLILLVCFNGQERQVTQLVLANSWTQLILHSHSFYFV